MKVHPISSRELWLAQCVLGIAILLQVAVWLINKELTYGPHNVIVAIEIALAILIGFSAESRHHHKTPLYRTVSLTLIGLLSVANITSFFLVVRQLITGSNLNLTASHLILAALAIFLTNIIVFALWYWEIDSPGLTGHKWSKHDKDFQFTQQNMPDDFPTWQPSFGDYLYLSVTNAINFAPADVKPLTLQAKGLMGTQALVSAFTLALVIARSVGILH